MTRLMPEGMSDSQLLPLYNQIIRPRVSDYTDSEGQAPRWDWQVTTHHVSVISPVYLQIVYPMHVADI